jgi:hypothetical protein
MAKREMIVTGFTGEGAEEQVDPYIRHLLGQFSDSLSEADKILLEYTSVKGEPDLYWAMYDTETFTLYSMGDSPSGNQACVSFGFEPSGPKQWKRLRDALNSVVTASMEID